MDELIVFGLIGAGAWLYYRETRAGHVEGATEHAAGGAVSTGNTAAPTSANPGAGMIIDDKGNIQAIPQGNTPGIPYM